MGDQNPPDCHLFILPCLSDSFVFIAVCNGIMHFYRGHSTSNEMMAHALSVKFGRILMYLNVTLWTLNVVCRKFKRYIPAFSCTCSYETISHMTEVNAESSSI